MLAHVPDAHWASSVHGSPICAAPETVPLEPVEPLAAREPEAAPLAPREPEAAPLVPIVEPLAPAADPLAEVTSHDDAQFETTHV